MNTIVNNELDWMEEDENLNGDFNSLKKKHHVDGFREGLSAGQSYILQSAFNTGFTVSAEYFEELSKLRGSLSALLMYLTSTKSCPKETFEKLETFILQLENLGNQQCHIDFLQSADMVTKSIEGCNTIVDKSSRCCKDKTVVDDDSGVDLVIDSMETMSAGLSDKADTLCSSTNTSTFHERENRTERKECKTDDCCKKLNQDGSDCCGGSIVCGNESREPDHQKKTLDITSVHSKINNESELKQYLHAHLSSSKMLANNLLSEVINTCEDIAVRGKITTVFQHFSSK